MIPRYQKILFVILVLISVGMGLMLWQLRDRAQRRMQGNDDAVPTIAPLVVPDEQARLVVADDQNNALETQLRTLPLPTDPGARARAVLGKLLDLYATPEANHPAPGGAAAISQVFLVPIAAKAAEAAPKPAETAHPAAPAQPASQNASKTPPTAGPLLAVVNLTGAFVATHPSGLSTENLTVLSICATLHANLPRVAQVRFLVDGAERPTLAGHADLTRTYLAADLAPVTKP